MLHVEGQFKFLYSPKALCFTQALVRGRIYHLNIVLSPVYKKLKPRTDKFHFSVTSPNASDILPEFMKSNSSTAIIHNIGIYALLST